jgi:hypothetical protein
MINSLPKIFFVIFITIFLFGCNAGVKFALVDDVRLNKDGTVTKLDGGVPEERRIAYYGQISKKLLLDKNYSKLDEKRFFDNEKNANTSSKEKCVYMLWFMPLNFWTYFSMDLESLTKQAIINANNSGKIGNIMSGINTTGRWFGGLTIGYDCKKLIGKVTAEVNQ